ncbi:pyridoxal phosphate-dependent decarboxylase family protein [Arthrobacter bambusae]|uniref:pyridoxal phosphate-dependent decarboxylase family protein n=1 Tax=Arthrobacter bambusae TaxID=1338426 RepID=UPI0027851407|nr:pyridoxal-dependent decarboxylase [Arthrobacter bambusae]MDQ0028995.1 glutamate/tyrosine decarboxylase-like PLP-dependent enzyme [Arthrobacter bambusae]MDQ0098603.1 glutamate/tyrosine decarboxylase-like PLP-dependent enzyme [Arthrobacter bambusae]
MWVDSGDYERALERAWEHSREWLKALPRRPVRPSTPADDVTAVFGGPLPATGLDPAEVIDFLAEHAEPGLMAMQSGRFFGWVIGGTVPAGMAADWMVSAWDQNSGLRFATPATAGIEEAAGQWLLELLGLPDGSDVGFATGASMANFTALAAARWRRLADVGWDVNADGLRGAPKLRVLVGAERHESLDMALRFLGLGAPEVIGADKEGRIDPAALRAALEAGSGPAIVCLQAGNLHSGAFDPFVEAIAAAKDHGAWVHVDGAFGLWAAAVPGLRHLVEGVELADSWGTDAHKTLNVPYDAGIVAVRDVAALRSAIGMHAEYLMQDDHGPADPMEKVPELSRRARGVPVWAALRSLGGDGVRKLVEGRVECAAELARRLAEVRGVEVLNDVVFTQLSLAFGSDGRTRAVTEFIMADGRVWMSGSRWQGRDILRVSVTNWSTDPADLDIAVQAIKDALEATA